MFIVADLVSLTVSCKLNAKTPNKAKDHNNEVTGRTFGKPVRRPRLNTGAWSSILISLLNHKTENLIMSLRSTM